MTTAMTRYTPAQIDEGGMDLASLGKVLAGSGYFQDTKDAAQAIVKVLAGRELGIGPIAAMTGIYLVKGRVTMSANLMAAQVKRSGRYTYVVAVMTDERVELHFQERIDGAWHPIGTSTFTKADAQQAGLWGSSDPWKKTPRNMLFARAMSNGCKWFTPDIFSGPVYTPDELDAQPAAAAYVDTATGEVLDAPAEEPVTRPAIRNPEHPATKAQENLIYVKAKEAGIPMSDVDACLSDYDPLTKAQASAIIDLIATERRLPPSPYAPQPASDIQPANVEAKLRFLAFATELTGTPIKSWADALRVWGKAYDEPQTVEEWRASASAFRAAVRPTQAGLAAEYEDIETTEKQLSNGAAGVAR